MLGVAENVLNAVNFCACLLTLYVAFFPRVKTIPGKAIYGNLLVCPGDQKDDPDRSLSENIVNLSKTGECRSALVSSVRLVVESTQLDDDEVDLDVVGDLDEHKPKTIISSFGFMIVLRFW